jgi:hypothetical protein
LSKRMSPHMQRPVATALASSPMDSPLLPTPFLTLFRPAPVPRPRTWTKPLNSPHSRRHTLAILRLCADSLTEADAVAAFDRFFLLRHKNDPLSGRPERAALIRRSVGLPRPSATIQPSGRRFSFAAPDWRAKAGFWQSKARRVARIGLYQAAPGPTTASGSRLSCPAQAIPLGLGRALSFRSAKGRAHPCHASAIRGLQPPRQAPATASQQPARPSTNIAHMDADGIRCAFPETAQCCAQLGCSGLRWRTASLILVRGLQTFPC